MTDRTWKVGPLAEASGLTVRTLHHWDEIGLLRPSRRTAAGHREYTEQDVFRLYEVLALRRLGLGLDSIAVCLDVGVDPGRLINEHLGSVAASIAALDTLRQRLERISAELAASQASVGSLIDVLQAIGRAGPEHDAALRRHLDTAQIDALRDRASTLGQAAHYLLEVEWPELYRRAEQLRADGTAPTDPRVQKLVKRMDELSVLFSGGDSELSSAVRAAWKAEPAAMSADPAAPVDDWRELADYLDRARAV